MEVQSKSLRVGLIRIPKTKPCCLPVFFQRAGGAWPSTHIIPHSLQSPWQTSANVHGIHGNKTVLTYKWSWHRTSTWMTFVLGQRVPSIAANIGEDLNVLIQTEKHKQTHTHTHTQMQSQVLTGLSMCSTSIYWPCLSLTGSVNVTLSKCRAGCEFIRAMGRTSLKQDVFSFFWKYDVSLDGWWMQKKSGTNQTKAFLV